MQMILRRNGAEIGRTILGGTISVDGLFISPVVEGWTLTIPEDSEFPLPGFYDLEAVPPMEWEPPSNAERRALMPVIYPTDFARLLKGLRTANYPDGVLPSDVEAIIDAIPDKATRELARWDFNRATKFERINPWIDIIGAMFPMSPEEMDVAWMAFVGAPA